MFQSTRPRGARLNTYIVLVADSGFNPRARGGRDRLTRSHHDHMLSFNPRARGGRDTENVLPLSYLSSFNPRARGGRDLQI